MDANFHSYIVDYLETLADVPDESPRPRRPRPTPRPKLAAPAFPQLMIEDVNALLEDDEPIRPRHVSAIESLFGLDQPAEPEEHRIEVVPEFLPPPGEEPISNPKKRPFGWKGRDLLQDVRVPILEAGGCLDYGGKGTTRLGEITFGFMGPRCANNGWCVIPQEQDGRRPAKVDGQILKWKKYQDEAPPIADVVRWSRQAVGKNVAVVCGAASGNVFALDIDVTDRDRCEAIHDVANATMGVTPFGRIGRYPKIALFYRVASKDLLPPNRTFRLLEEDGETISEHMIEIQGQGKAVTVFGRHHATGERFSWIGAEKPSSRTPEDVPLVTPEQIEAFLASVEGLREIASRGAGALAVDCEVEWTEAAGGIRMPRLRGVEGSPWNEGADGRVTGGREAFLFELSSRACRANASACNSSEGKRSLIAAVTREALERIATDHKRHAGWIKSEVRSKVLRTAARIADGELKARPSYGPGRVEKPSTPLGMSFAAEPRTDEPMLMSREDAQDVVYSTVTDFLLATAAWAREPEETRGLPPAWMLRATASLGKTTGTLRARVAEDVLAAFEELRNQHGKFPIAVLLPDHRVAAEVAAKARKLGLAPGIVEDDGGVAHHYGRGHPMSGCAKEFQERAAAVATAGISASGGCKAEIIDKNGEARTDYCIYHPENPNRPADVPPCRFVTMQQSLDRFDLVISVHAYAVVPIPESLKACKAVIVDESIAGLLTAERIFDRAVLLRKRADPRLTKEERKALCGREDAGEGQIAGVVNDWHRRRDRLVRLVIQEWDAKRDPAEMISTSPDRMANLEIAMRICSRARQSSARVTPRTSLREAIELAAGETGEIAEALREEHRMWKLLDERVRKILEHRASKSQIPLIADDRVWPLADGKVQVAWNRKWNFADKPCLFLDASGDRWQLERVLGRSFEMHDAPVALDFRTTLVHSIRPREPGEKRLRTCTFTKSRFVVRKSDEEKVRKEKAELLRDVRREILTKAAAFGDGRILVAAPKAVEELLLKDWTPPANADFIHFGAVRGQDWAKRHSACLIFGVQYPNPTSIDGQVAALAYAAGVEEDRIDPNGTGLIDGERIPYLTEDRRIPMRDGEDIHLPTMTYAGSIARKLLDAVADQELIQTAARLRPIWRDDRPALFLYGDRVPEGIVVDELSTLAEELEKGAAATLEAAVEKGGVIAPDTVGEKEFAAFVERISGNALVSAAFFTLSDGARIVGWVSDEEVGAIAAERSATVAHVRKRRPAEMPPEPPKPAERSERLQEWYDILAEERRSRRRGNEAEADPPPVYERRIEDFSYAAAGIEAIPW